MLNLEAMQLHDASQFCRFKYLVWGLTMASAADKALEELRMIQDYLRSQQTVLTSTNMQSVLDQQCTTWETKLRSTVIPAQDASKFVVELGSGPWQEAHKARLSSAIDDAVREAVQPSSKRRPSQTLNDFGAFLSVKDMTCLRDEGIPTSVKIDTIVSRMLNLHLHLPTEPTVKAIVSAGIAAGLVCNSAVDSLTLVREIKRRLKLNLKGKPQPPMHLVEYPASPALLPSWIEAYQPDDQPTQERLNESDVQNLSSSIALRCSSKLLRPQNQLALAAPSQPSQPSSSSSAQATPQTMMMQMFSQFGQFMQQQMHQQVHQQQPAGNINLQIYGPKRTSFGATPAGATTVASPTTVVAAPVAQSTPERQPALQNAIPNESQDTQQSEASPHQVEKVDKALQLPDLPELPPPDQMEVIAAAAKKRTDANKENAKATKPKAKAKGKAKAKSKAKAKAKSKAMAKPDVSENDKKATDHGNKAKAKAKAQAVVPKQKAKAKAKANPKAKAKAMACLPSSRRNRPPVMQLGDPTVYHEKGKIHRNAEMYRVFVRSSDRCDRKVRIGDDVEAAWDKALGIIEAEPESPPDIY